MVGDTAAPRAESRLGAPTLAAWIGALLVAALALAPRTIGLADFYTIDESYHWIGRVERFSAALQAGDWAETNQTGHPGVTTMWLGSLGYTLAGLLGVENPGWAGGGAAFLGLLRLPLAVANSLAVALGYLLLRRLLSPGTALLGAILWALSPFLVAHSRLLHLDALLTSFMMLSLLMLLVALKVQGTGDRGQGATTDDRPPTTDDRPLTTDHRPPTTDHRLPNIAGDRRPASAGFLGGEARWWLVGSGVCCGLALVTKAPSLLLLPVAGLLLMYALLRHHNAGSRPLRRLVALGLAYALWLGAAALTAFAVWPAMWAAPLEAAGGVLREIRDNGAQPHHSGNFFLGEPVGVPDARFYPAVVLWRTTPVTLIGLFALLACAIHDVRSTIMARGARKSTRGREDAPPALDDGRTLLALAGFALLFGLALTLQAKKLDRYLLPIFPALEILAAAGLVRLAGYRWRLLGRLRNLLLWPLVTATLLLTVLVYHPSYLSYFNPLLGGGATAQRVMLVGLGEGMEQVGAWLRARPDLGRGDVLSWIPPTLAPFVPQSTLVRDLRPAYLASPSSYAVLYVRSVQHKESAEAEAYVRQTPALFTLRMHGVEYATVHQLPRPFEMPLGAVFDGGLHLRGYSSKLLGSTLVVTPSWDIQADRPGGVVSFVHVLAPDGSRVAQVDAPLDQGMFAAWQAGQQFDSPLPIALPPGLAPGAYRLAMGLYTPDGARLPLTAGDPLPPDLAGPHAILLGTLEIP
jgi:4-amino-4-deoxy-L-arabinose transferase-like glycosyltransferase